jgi:hypothetical protein
LSSNDLYRRTELIAAIAHGLDHILAAIVSQFPADSAHKNVDRTIERIRIASAGEVKQLFPGQQPSRPREQSVQQIEFGARQFDFLEVAVSDATPERFHFEACKFVDTIVCRRHPDILPPAQDSADSRDQFPRIEGFTEVIVGAELKSYNAIDLLLERRQQDYREGRFLRAQVTTHIQTGAIRKHHIQNCQIDRVCGYGLSETLQIRSQRDPEVLSRKIFSQQLRISTSSSTPEYAAPVLRS